MRGEIFADDAVFDRFVDRRELRLVRHPHQVGIGGIAVRRGLFGEPDAVRPLDFKRRQRQEQRSGEVAFAADRGLRDGFLAGEERDALGQFRRRHVVLVNVVHGAGDGGPQRIERETRNAPDAGFPGRQFCPIVLFADAKGGDEAHAGNGDDRAAGIVALRARLGSRVGLCR